MAEYMIKRQFQFDAAHMLSNYDGKCNNLHGHTYTGEAWLFGGAYGEDGMILDFNEIKKVIDEYDHAVLFSGISSMEEKEKELLMWAEKWGMKHKFIQGKCTAEHIATQIANELIEQSTRIRSVKVVLHETPDSTVCASNDAYDN